MRRGILHTCTQLLNGQSIARILMNEALARKSVSGRVIDVGGGRAPDYFQYLNTSEATSIEAVDGSLSGINFETDSLPYDSKTIDTVLLCNTLEHVYNYQFLTNECARVLAPGGRLVGFVPFLVGYHPDPHDYFRYTKEGLTRILAEAGFTHVVIEEVGGGPVLANFNTIVLSYPRVLRPFIYLFCQLFDALFLMLRPRSRERAPMGYLFEATIHHA